MEVMPSHLSLATGTCLVVHLSQSLASMTKNSSLLRDCVTLNIDFFDFLYSWCKFLFNRSSNWVTPMVFGDNMNNNIYFDSRYLNVSKSNWELQHLIAIQQVFQYHALSSVNQILHKLPWKSFDLTFHDQMLSPKDT